MLSAAPFNVSPLLFYVGPPPRQTAAGYARAPAVSWPREERTHDDDGESSLGGERLGRLKLIRLYGRGDVMYGLEERLGGCRR